MKKNTLHKVMATALVGAMAMGTLTGCGGSTDAGADASTKDTAAVSTAASTDAGTAAVAGIDGWEPFASNVTLQIPVYDRGSSGNGCSDVENNYWTKWVQENFGDKYNITVEYVGITRSDVMTDYAMLAASQSLPTICMEYDYDKLASCLMKIIWYLVTDLTATLLIPGVLSIVRTGWKKPASLSIPLATTPSC